MRTSPCKTRKRKAYNEPGHAHFLTFSCCRDLSLFATDTARQWFLDALRNTRANQNVDLHAYVIMPEHVHVVLRPRKPDYDMAGVQASLKRSVSWKAKQHLKESGNVRWLRRLTVCEGAREIFRFWQPGGGFDRNLWNKRAINEAIAYIHNNPVRRGLVETPTDWLWSSARFWAGMHGVLLAMDPIPQ
jgi:putative transposase